MYYSQRNKITHLNSWCGTKTENKFDLNCKLYTSENGQYYSTGYPIFEEEIIDYSKTRTGRYTLSSSVFGDEYAQCMSKPVKHRWRRVDLEPEAEIMVPRELNCATGYQWIHAGDFSDYPTYWAKPEYQLRYVLPRKTYWGGSTFMQDWASMKTDSRTHLPSLFKDSRLLNLEQVDCATFLAELRDLKQLGNLIKFKKDHTDISDKYLGVSFGVLPLVSDIKKMYENVQAMPNAFDSWNQMADREKTRAYHKTVNKSEDSGTHVIATGNRGGLLNASYTYKYHWKQKYVEKIHTYVKPHRIADTTDLALQASLWGFDKPLTTIWNLVPMSFAVDWVVNIGDIISDFEYRSPDLKFDIVDATFSRKLETEITTEVWLNIQGISACVGTTKTTAKEYIRIPIPLAECNTLLQQGSFGPLELNVDFTPKQITLGAALAHQRAFKG